MLLVMVYEDDNYYHINKEEADMAYARKSTHWIVSHKINEDDHTMWVLYQFRGYLPIGAFLKVRIGK